MKRLILSIIALAVSISPLTASVRYVQLMPVDSVVNLDPTDIVEVLSAGGGEIRLDFRDGSSVRARGLYERNFIYTDLFKIDSLNDSLCLKITSKPQSQSSYIQETPRAQSFAVDPSALIECVAAHNRSTLR